MRIHLFQYCPVCVFFVVLLLAHHAGRAQKAFNLLQATFDSMAKQEAFRDASISFTLIDIASGDVLFEKNKDLALAPASTVKTFTTATALHHLGAHFQYKTRITFRGKIVRHHAVGELRVYGSGDPSLGSDRYASCRPELVFRQIAAMLRKAGIHTLKGKITVIDTLFNDEAVNAGWLDEDVGNYYGAGIHGFNWKENKFSLGLRYGDSMFTVSENNGGLNNRSGFCIELVPKQGATTESAFAYLTPDSTCAYTIRGYLSPKDTTQTIQLARIDPTKDFCRELHDFLQRQFHFETDGAPVSGNEMLLGSIRSPHLDSLVYACNQKSLNLYAEALCKTTGSRGHGHGNWKLGIGAMQRYAAGKGLDKQAIRLQDASGLSPTNRITTFILASLLRAYTKEKWYPVFYNSLPVINGLRMKSGYIGGTRAYAGYITLPNKQKAGFSFIISQYSCSPQQVKADMFALLDRLKALP